MEAKYLMITIHDSDFIYELQCVGKYLNDIWGFTEKYPTNEQDLHTLNPIIQDLIFKTYSLITGRSDVEYSYFEPDLKIVNYLDIPEYDDYSQVFVPLFSGEIITA